MIKKRYSKQQQTRRKGLDRNFLFTQTLPKKSKYILGTCIACIGVTSLAIPIIPGRLLILTSISIFTPSRYLKYIGFRYRSNLFLATVNNHQSALQQNFHTTPKIIRKSFQLKIKKRIS